MRVRLAILLVAAVFAAGCSSDSGDGADPGEPGEPASDSAGDEAAQDADADADAGQVEESTDASEVPPSDSGAVYTVDGEPFGGDLFSCDPSDGAGDAEPGDLELVVLTGPSEGLSIDVWHTERQGPDGAPFDQMRVDVRVNRVTDEIEEYSTIFDHDSEDNWSSGADVVLDEPPITIDGARMVGSVTLPQDFPPEATGSVDVTFDFEIPEVSC